MITDADYADDLCIISDLLNDATVLLHRIEEAAIKIGLLVNAKKTEFMAFNQAHTGSIKSKTNQDIKAVQEFTYLGSNIASTKRDIEIRLAKAWSALNKLDKIWTSNLSPKLKRNFFRATVESILLYGATTWTITKNQEKMLDGAYTRMLRAILNVSWREHPTKKSLYGGLLPISQTLRQRRLRFAGHCFRSKEELASDLVLWQPNHGFKTRGRPARTYPDQLSDDLGCLKEDLPVLMRDRTRWKEQVIQCRVRSTR